MGKKKHNAASTKSSIWSSISEEKFLNTVRSVAQQSNTLPGAFEKFPRLPNGDQNRTLALNAEQQLTQDLAYIAASEYGVHTVSAATVTESDDGLVITIASNSGVQTGVKDHFTRISQNLEQCAKNTISVSKCQDHVFDAVVEMDQNRILGRVRASIWESPLWYKSAGSLEKTFSEAVSRIVKRNPKLQAANDLNTKAKQFSDTCKKLDNFSQQNIVQNLKDVILSAQEMAGKNNSLKDYLDSQELCLPHGCAKAIDELDKVANYWRLSQRLALMCASKAYGNLFNCIRCVFLECFEKRTVGQSKAFVHAEVQLATHHRVERPAIMPRSIGTSKAACFLCNLFLKQHSHYHVTATHGKIFDQWTIPDIREYTDDDRRDIRRVIQSMYESLLAIIRMTSLPSRKDPTQSFLFYTPCISQLSINSFPMEEQQLKEALQGLRLDENSEERSAPEHEDMLPLEEIPEVHEANSCEILPKQETRENNFEAAGNQEVLPSEECRVDSAYSSLSEIAFKQQRGSDEEPSSSKVSRQEPKNASVDNTQGRGLPIHLSQCDQDSLGQSSPSMDADRPASNAHGQIKRDKERRKRKRRHYRRKEVVTIRTTRPHKQDVKKHRGLWKRILGWFAILACPFGTRKYAPKEDWRHRKRHQRHIVRSASRR